MNKRCTNSSCRKTFSTLAYNGQCPYCGKKYPQLTTARKHGTPSCFYVRLNIGKKERIRISLDPIMAYLSAGKRMDAVKAFRAEAIAQGYAPVFLDSIHFCNALTAGEKPCTSWGLTSDRKDGLPIIACAGENK